MTDNIVDKVAVQTEDSRNQGRRAFLKGSAAVAGGVMFTSAANAAGGAGFDPKKAVAPYAGKAEITDVLQDGAARKSLGFGVRKYPYGMPSPFEKEVQRRTLEWLTPDSMASITMSPIHQLNGIITPNGLHFERYHGGVPTINPDDHRLVIHGLVERPLIFTMDDLKRFPSISRIHFIECPANGALEWKGVQLNSVQWTHGMMSCVEYTGVRLSDLLKEAGIKPEGKWIIPEGADASGMSRSVPVELAMDDCFVAYAQNGEALRREQGYPIRLVVPGCEANMWVKYLRRIMVHDVPIQHREETSKYTELMPDGTAQRFSWYMEANSVITYPSPDFKMQGPGKYYIRGLAWSGRGKVANVDISIDGGKNWKEAHFTSVVLDKAWTRFEMEWEWDGSEAFLMSRVTDETGYVQPPMPQMRNLEGTNNVYHRTAMVTWRVHGWDQGKNGGMIENVQY
ncbi:sulfite dehydrogenase [Thiomicrorhabdus arctica]|uniref:sulfite dehydrogenase n=1 Tax=Thiomicrorhabdus arctica TaxID=131540 RepID=UPI00037D58FB|nr:sulfite dehydrogenase [Thiomicrorhabdus arctica]